MSDVTGEESPNHHGPNWVQALTIAVVTAITAATLSGYFANRNLERQLEATSQQQLVQFESDAVAERRAAQRTAFTEFLRADQALADRVSRTLSAAIEVAAGQQTLEQSEIVLDSTWNPIGNRLRRDNFIEGRRFLDSLAAVALVSDDKIATCAAKLSTLYTVYLWDISNLVTQGRFEWAVEMIDSGELSADENIDLEYAGVYNRMQRDLRLAIVDLMRAELDPTIEPSVVVDPCRDLPTHVAGGPAVCPDPPKRESRCREITVAELLAN